MDIGDHASPLLENESVSSSFPAWPVPGPRQPARVTPLRILIYAIGSAGDVHPFVGIGRGLQARGHEVFVITSGHFENLITIAGLGFRMLGTADDFKRAQEDMDLWHPFKGFPTIVKRAMNPSYQPILTHARELHLRSTWRRRCSPAVTASRSCMGCRSAKGHPVS